MDSSVKRIAIIAALAVASFIGLGLLFGSWFTVAEYERGVVTTWGRYSYTATPGLGLKVPFVQGVTKYRTDILSMQPEKPVNTYTIDNQEVDIVFTVFYRVPADKVEFIYQNAQDYRGRLFDMAVDRLKSEMGKVNVAHVAEQRGNIRAGIHKTLAHDAKTLGVEVTDFQLTNIEYTKGYKVAVEQQAVARQMVDTKQRQLEQAEKDAQKARVDAQGAADAKLAHAKAEAEAIRIKGEAEAAAIRAQAAALAQNAQLVELRKAEKWNGALPTQMLSSVTPFMQFNAPSNK